MKKLLLVLAAVASIAGGKVLAFALFSSPYYPYGGEMTGACTVFCGIVLWFIYQIIQDYYQQETELKILEYEERMSEKFEEIDNNNLWLNIRILSEEFEEGRRGA